MEPRGSCAGGGGGWPGCSLCGDVQGIIGNGHKIPSLPVDRQTDITENIAFLQLRWRAVISPKTKK